MKNIPSSISFKELAGLLAAARPEHLNTQDELSVDWSDRVKALLGEVEQFASQVAEEKTVDQVMALGSLRSYLMLSLRAMKAADV